MNTTASRRKLPTLTLFAMVIMTAVSVYTVWPAKIRPARNVVLLVLDTLRADHLGCYGFDGAISPHLDALATEGVRFEHAVAQAPWTFPSMATLFTSRYPLEHGLNNIWTPEQRGDDPAQYAKLTPLSPQFRTVAENLADAGFRTGSFNANSWLSPVSGIRRGFQTVVDGDIDHDLVSQALEWYDGCTECRKFLHVQLMTAHGPYLCSLDGVASLWNSKSLVPSTTISEQRFEKLAPYIAQHLPAGSTDAQKRDPRFLNACYADEIRRLDAVAGKLIDGLRSRPHWENTLFIIASDHGEEFFEHKRFEHGQDLYFHSLNVPLLMRLPGGTLPGATIGATARLIDLAPTILEFAKLPVPPEMRGESLIPMIAGNDTRNRPAFSCCTRSNPDYFGIERDNSKLIIREDSPRWQLYDLANDPHEKKQLDSRAIAEPLLEEIARFRAMAHVTESAPVTLPPSDVKRLETLGYLK